MMKKNRVRKYILYAIGEIILVVIGILIALQINNWNDKRIQKSQLKSVFKVVKEDLKTDTLMVSQIVQFYDTINKYSIKIMMDEITTKNLDSCKICPSLVTVYRPMTTQKKGYKLLQNFSDNNTIKPDSLATNITQFYAIFNDLITNNNDLVKKEVLENLDYFKKQPWFLNWMQGIKDPRVLDYFGSSADFKNRVAAHNILAAQNHQRVLKIYKEQAIQLIAALDERIENKDKTKEEEEEEESVEN